MSELALFRRLPRGRGRIPRIPIGNYPTPLDRWDQFGRWLGVDGFWVKRDDLTAVHFGGNKVRAAEFVLGAAIEKDRPLVVFAPVGSSWAACCAFYGRVEGAKIDFYLFRWPASPVTEPNTSIVRAWGRHTVISSNPVTAPLRFLLDRARSGGPFPGPLPPGGSSPASVLGYVSAVLELDEQLRASRLPPPDAIFVPLGSGGTAAGVAAGVGLLGWPTRVIAVRVTNAIVANRFGVTRMAKGAIRNLARVAGGGRGTPIGTLEVEGRFFGGRYGRPTPEGSEAAGIVRRLEGCDLDPAYTAKTVAALIRRVREGDLAGKNVLYWHTWNSRDPRPILAPDGGPASPRGGATGSPLQASGGSP